MTSTTVTPTSHSTSHFALSTWHCTVLPQCSFSAPAGFCPIAERPLLNGWCAIDRGRIAAVGRAGAALPFRDDAPLVDLGDMAVLPALTNAHTHLELSWMRGRVPRGRSLHRLGARRCCGRGVGDPPPDDAIVASVKRRLARCARPGTGLVGDVSNTLVSVAPLRESPLGGVVFHELLRLAAADADAVLEQGLDAVKRCGASSRVPVSLAPHAPYSVSPRLFQGIRAAQERTPFLPSTVHLAESPEEVELLATGDGPWRDLLQDLGAWDPSWTVPRTDPVSYLDQMKVLNSRLLAVHGVQLDDAALDRLKSRGTTLVTCPRSNAYVGVGDPPVERFYRSGVQVAVGTDSLASNDDLNLFVGAGGAAPTGAVGAAPRRCWRARPSTAHGRSASRRKPVRSNPGATRR